MKINILGTKVGFIMTALFSFCGSLNLYALDAKSGKLNTRFETGGKIYASPKVYENIVYIGSEDGYCYAISLLPSDYGE